MKDKKDEEKKKKKKRKNFKVIVTIIPIIISIISLGLSITSICNEDKQNELMLKPRFSLEKVLNEDGSFVWKISNLGGAINNATIYPRMYVLFSEYDEEKDENKNIFLEMLNYFNENNYYYRNSDGSFYIKDDKPSELDNFIEKYTKLLESDGIEDISYRIDSYFELHYNDYRGKSFNKIYTLVNDELFENDPDHKVFGNTMKQLKEVSKIPKPDIIAPLKFEKSCVISIYYENAVTKQPIDDEQTCNEYIHAVILDLFDSKKKPIEEMYGEGILSNNKFWSRDVDTGELIFHGDDIEDFGFAEDEEQ